ncbi:YqaJ viral recombinase family protein [Methylicorpusculum oleiharenae]|uniref:YqaJ viral recombinase family nuclease n=1 Tax=Methylicorpusculum oleiharenae TaxID=1338687 RepID=UPI0013593DC9|nr:YqaJ viral recombinase family protein [Methylicorpusculum oleiharenae]MCD2450541.1 YqaJ viral recombinase family protein [Methylicorpusculum oleiharenae]
MKVIDVSQRSAAWRHWRSQGVSASEAAIVMNRSPYKTPWRLWAEKIGLVLEASLDNNPLIRAGIQQEPAALQRFEDKHDQMLLPLCGESEQYPLMRASFDGLSDANEPVEIKCPHETTFLDVLLNREASEAYQLYWCQVQQQLLVSEAQRGFLFFYHQGQDIEFEIQRDETFLTKLVESAMDFWSAVQSKKEPNKDPERDLYLPKGDAEQQWQQLAASYRNRAVKIADLKAELATLEASQAAIENTLVLLMGDYVAAEHSGLRISRFQSQGAIDYKVALHALQPAVQAAALEVYRKPSATRVRVTCRDDDGKHAEVPFDAQALQDLAGVDFWF